MPTRMLREGILTSDRIALLSWGAETFYRRLMSIVDDYGRYDGRVLILMARCYPLQLDRVSPALVQQWLDEVAAAELVLVYEVDGKQYLQLDDFGQRIQSPSKWPPPGTDVPRCPRSSPESTVKYRKRRKLTAVVGVVDVVECEDEGGERKRAEAPLQAGVRVEFPADWKLDQDSIDRLAVQAIPPPDPNTVAMFVGHMAGKLIEPRLIGYELLKFCARQRRFDEGRITPKSTAQAALAKFVNGDDDASDRSH